MEIHQTHTFCQQESSEQTKKNKSPLTFPLPPPEGILHRCFLRLLKKICMQVTIHVFISHESTSLMLEINRL